MFGNALKIGLRTFYREKLYAFINLSGLSLAIASVIIIGLYLFSEFTYDRHFDGYENIYRIETEITTDGDSESYALTSQTFAPLIAKDNPDTVIEAVKFSLESSQAGRLTYEGTTYGWDNVYSVSPNVFKVFSHEIVYGDPETALIEPGTLAVSETFARTYFGASNPIGKVVTNVAGRPWKVNLVFKDLPENTHFKYDVLYTHNNPIKQEPTDLAQQRSRLYDLGYYTYLKMKDGFDPEKFNSMFQRFFDTNMKEMSESSGLSWRAWAQPLAKVHLHSNVGNDFPTSNIYYLYAFVAVSLLILIVACINYINLSTARFTKRTQEVGMKKIMGASYRSLIAQYLSESFLYTLISIVAAIVMVELVFELTPINDLLQKNISFSLFENNFILIFLLALGLFIGLVSGLYPAFYLSSTQPVDALTNKGSSSSSDGFGLRSLLVFIQFAISIGVIASTLLMIDQVSYIHSKELGYKKENRIVVTMRGLDVIDQFPQIQSELLKNSNILGAALSEGVISDSIRIKSFNVEKESGEFQNSSYVYLPVSEDFIEVMGFNLLEGNSFKSNLANNAGTDWIVNQAFVDKMGWQNPIGKRITDPNDGLDGRVIGIVEDYHYESLHKPIQPVIMYVLPEGIYSSLPDNFRPFFTRYMTVSISGQHVHESLQFVENLMNQFDRINSFEHVFLEDELDNLYKSEDRLVKLTGLFSAICIFISCLGLYGLISFNTEQRSREIGIRKVLGATATQIIWNLSKNIVVLIAVGAVIASALSFLVIDRWLAAFAYRVDINLFAFMLSTLIAMLIAYLTVVTKSYNIANSAPSKAIRYQ